MCLGIPMRVRKIEGDAAWVETDGITKKISAALMADLRLGDYVIVHAGFAIEKLNQSEAKETLRLLREAGATE
jgi:hydrogenase expression/formation protein HypC